MIRKATRLADLAAMSGLSISTVSRALSDSPSINAQTKQRIWQLAREHGYALRRSMPAGPEGADAIIAIIVPRPQGRDNYWLSDPFFLELFAGVGDAARQRDCDFLVSHVSPDSFEDLRRVMSTTRADGVIFLGQSHLHEAFNRLADVEDRFAVWGAQLPDQRYCCVGSDNVLGGRRAALHLARRGRRHIIFLGDTEAPEADQRRLGYLEGLTQAGLDVDPALIVDAHFEVESAEASVESLIHRGVTFDGVVAASDLIALGAIRALRRAGRAVPKDVSVIGYDNVPFARYSGPALSTIAQNTARAGRLLVSKLLDHQGEGALRSERVATDLIVRESCGG